MRGKYLILCFILSLILSSCAKRGSPDGGPIDEIPPEFIRANPENFSINFDEKEIEIFFDEYIRLEEPQRQIIVSPPMERPPAFTPLGAPQRSVEIEIFDTLQENTTYTINFGRSIVDNNEGNPLPFFQYVFSTGSYIDSLSVSGTVADAFLKEPEPFISVMLYEVDSSYTDSVIYQKPPRYITNTLDSSATFQLNNLKEGTYQLVALKDNNNNYLFEPGVDKIAFLEDFIQIPTDSTFHLNLFKEDLPFEILPRPEQVAQQHLLFAYTGVRPENYEIELIAPPTPEDFTSRITKDRETDTLHYWYKPFLETDSLHFVVSAPDFRDTLLARTSEMERDSLQINVEPSGQLDFNETVKIIPTVPLNVVHDSLIQLYNKDTLPVPFEVKYDRFLNEIIVDFEKQENESYQLISYPGAFTGFFGGINDTLDVQLSTRAYADYGSVTFNLQNLPSSPVIAQLTNKEGEMQAEKYLTTGNSVTFNNISPGSYFLRLIIDKDEDREWDTGSYLLEQQPEKIIYFPEPIDIRANWEISQPFIIPENDPGPAGI